MAGVKREGDLITIGDRVRVEPGPAFQTAIATPELLSNEATASHYEAGKPDARGKIIALGEEFSYLDHGGSVAEGKRVFYVFEKVEIPEADRAKDGAETTDEFRWIERGTRATEDGAISLGQQIAGE